MKVVVLAGGKGTRLGLGDLPKALVPIGGVPLLQRTVTDAVGYGFTDFIFLTGYLGDVIERHFGDGAEYGATIEHVRESIPLGTAGCFNQIRDRLNEPFIVVYSDILMKVDFAAFARFALSKGGAGTLFAHPNDHPYDSDLLETDENGRILAVHPKPHLAGAHRQNLVSAALYILAPRALDYVDTNGPSDWGRDVFPRLARDERLFAYRSCEYVKDIGTPARLERASRHLAEGRLENLYLRRRKPAIFLDRDGVINQEVGGLHKAKNARLIPGVAKAVRSFNDLGVPVICVTNQPDLAKGMMSAEDLREVTGEIDHLLADEAGAYLDDIYICPHHPERGWPGEVEALKIDCDCRKPRDGLLRRAAADHNIDLERSWFVGDRYCDVAAGNSAGTGTILVETGHGGDDKERYPGAEADHICSNLSTAAAIILEEVK